MWVLGIELKSGLVANVSNIYQLWKKINDSDHWLVFCLLEFSYSYGKFYFVFTVRCAKCYTVCMFSSHRQIGSCFPCQHTKIHPTNADGSVIRTYVLFLCITWIIICWPISNPTFFFCLLCKLQFYAEYPHMSTRLPEFVYRLIAGGGWSS